MTPASTLDLISFWMDAPSRRLDFALSTALRDPISADALLLGAKRARARYPRADRILSGEGWIPSGVPAEALLEVRTGAREAAIDDFLRVPLDPSREPALKQMVLIEGARTELVTRSHHAAADLMSVLFFLRAQLEGAKDGPCPELTTKTHASPVRKSRFGQRGPSTRLWTRRMTSSGERSVRRVELDARGIRDAIPAGAGFTFNDLLGSVALGTLRRFQEAHHADTSGLSLWFPINVRSDPWEGFGNGSSRIRIYERHLSSPSFSDRARAFRAQVAWSKEHGEWAVPSEHPLLRLPLPLRRPVLRAYLRRPWVDMGTMLFSHVERLGSSGEPLAGVGEIEIQSNLDRRHAVGLAGITVRGRTQLSFTFDPSLLDDADADELASMYLEEIARAERELERCAA